MKSLNIKAFTFIATILSLFFFTSCEEENLCIGSQAKFDYEIKEDQNTIILEWYTDVSQWSDCLITVNNMKMFFIGSDGDTISPGWFLERIAFRDNKPFREPVQIPASAEIGILSWETDGQQATKRFEFEPDGVQDDPDDDGYYQFRQKATNSLVDLYVKIPDLVQTSNGILENGDNSKFVFKSNTRQWSIALFKRDQFDSDGTLIQEYTIAGFNLNPNDEKDVFFPQGRRQFLDRTVSVRMHVKDQQGVEYYTSIP